ncbi:MAG: hypothetical protein OQL06_09975 [Gammaproteobacteria bacterium]|nr:hypothetical protein [Gammaproteobacteria bacterium]
MRDAIDVNPATGLPMLDDGAVDVCGNVFGDDSFSSFDDSFSSDDSFGFDDCFSSFDDDF